MRQRTIKNFALTMLILEIWFGIVNSKNIESIIINGDNDIDQIDHKVEQQSKIENNIQQFRQFNVYRHKETTADNFIRLLVMRLIYGLAVTMGIEDRLEGLFNGAFVPPNADSDYYFALGGFSDYADDARSNDDANTYTSSFNEILDVDA